MSTTTTTRGAEMDLNEIKGRWAGLASGDAAFDLTADINPITNHVARLGLDLIVGWDLANDQSASERQLTEAEIAVALNAPRDVAWLIKRVEELEAQAVESGRQIYEATNEIYLLEQPATAAAVEHGMIPGSHERSGGAECKCGASWDYWGGKCGAEASR